MKLINRFNDQVKSFRNNSGLRQFINSDFALFFILTAVTLWFPGRIFNLAPIIIPCFAFMLYWYKQSDYQYDIRPYQLLMLFYGLWIIISGGMHYFALSRLGPDAFITMRPNNAAWGLFILKVTCAAYILFPAFMFTLINIFKNTDNALILLPLIPIVFIPSLLVAFYQEFFDINFMNPTITFFLQKITGLSSDFNGFRVTLFLLIPLSVLGAIIF